MSLVAVLVAVGITGIVGMILSQIMSNGFKAQSKITLDVDKAAVKQLLLTATSCSASLPTGLCTASTLLPLSRKNNAGTVTPLVSSSTPTYFGRWAVRALCNTTGDGIDLEMARLKAGASLTTTAPDDFYPDPLSGTTSEWGSTAAAVFPPGVSLCEGSTSVMHIEKGINVASLTSSCPSPVGTWFCATAFSINITFAKPYTVAPTVIVNPSGAIQGLCAVGASDQFVAYPTAISKTGFSMICSASPWGNNCFPYQDLQLPAVCSWTAIGAN